jgi:glycosyltransferase involved in cell wall biosynthesis
MTSGYLLISPCRNEEDYMRRTLDSVIAQSVPPARWVIVDDGSTDSTPQILAEYAARHPWIQVVTRSDRGHRAVGPGVIDAFYAGYESVDASQYEFLCKLDLDLDLPLSYFEILMQRMHDDPRIATCSGKSYVRNPAGVLVHENHGDDTSIGATKFYRTRMFLALGGFVRQVMWDGIDNHRCRMHGWRALSWDEPALRFEHLRLMGSSQQSIFTGRMRHGFGQYFMGTAFWFMFASALFRIADRPAVLGAGAILWGWVRSALQGVPRYEEPGFRPFLRTYQREALLLGKRRAVARAEERGLRLAAQAQAKGAPR